MHTVLKAVTASAIPLIGGLAFSQATPPPEPGEPPPMLVVTYDPQQLPMTRGELDRFTFTARGDIDGFIFRDGTEVKTAPGLSTQIALAMRPGDRISVHGLRAAALPLVRAMSVTDEATHRTVTDIGASPEAPPPPPGPPRRDDAPRAGSISETSGRVRLVLHGIQGEVNGALLESGTILRFPPDQSAQLMSFLQPHQPIIAEGFVSTTAMGSLVEVQQLGPSRDRLITIDPPMSVGGPAGRRPPPPPLDREPPRSPVS
jgi:hypothetical protein